MTQGWLFVQALLFAVGVVLAAFAAFPKVDARVGWAAVACISGGLFLVPLNALFIATT